MSKDDNKVTCSECDWKGRRTELLTAENPFESNCPIFGCPQCHGIDCCRPVCDEPACWEVVTCGTPTSEGYRLTCSKHHPIAEAAKEPAGD